MTRFYSIQSRASSYGRGSLVVLLTMATMGGVMSGTAAAAPRRGVAVGAAPAGLAAVRAPGGPAVVGAAPGAPAAVEAAPGDPAALEGGDIDESLTEAGTEAGTGAGTGDESLVEASPAGGAPTVAAVAPAVAAVAPLGPVAGRRAAVAPVAAAPAARNKTVELVWHYLFRIPITGFEKARRAGEHKAVLDWSSDGCSKAPDRPSGFDFLPSCQRHDFGYRNYKRLQMFNERTRKLIDDHFKQDLYHYCDHFSGLMSFKGVACRRIADTYWLVVRNAG